MTAGGSTRYVYDYDKGTHTLINNATFSTDKLLSDYSMIDTTSTNYQTAIVFDDDGKPIYAGSDLSTDIEWFNSVDDWQNYLKQKAAQDAYEKVMQDKLDAETGNIIAFFRRFPQISHPCISETCCSEQAS